MSMKNKNTNRVLAGEIRQLTNLLASPMMSRRDRTKIRKAIKSLRAEMTNK